MHDAGFVKAMNGRLFKYRCVKSGLQGEPSRWFVCVQGVSYTVKLGGAFPGVYRVYRDGMQDGTREFIGYSPTLPFALRLCASETQRLAFREAVRK